MVLMVFMLVNIIQHNAVPRILLKHNFSLWRELSVYVKKKKKNKAKGDNDTQ